jgi:hypothetical protein
VTRRRITAILLPVLAAIGVAAGTAAAATSHHAVAQHAAAQHGVAQHGAAKAGVPEVFNCLHAQVRPGSYTLTCADGNNYLSHLSWASWSASSASGTGTEMVNDCTPYCAAGKFRGYRADVIFWRPEPVPQHAGQRYFSRVTLLYPGARPPAYSHGKQVNGPEAWTGALASQTALQPARPS